MSSPNNVVFFDDLCNLCDHSVSFLIKIDRKKVLKHSSLEGNLAKQKIDNPEAIQSVVFLKNDKIYTRSEAAIKILITLGGGYKFIGIALSIFPYMFLNLFYNLIGKNRYKLFGQKETCRVPNKEEVKLFID